MTRPLAIAAMTLQAALAAGGVLAVTPAHAVLGQPIQAAMAASGTASKSIAAAPPRSLPGGVQVYERLSGDGGWIREFASSQGIVFAVAWNTRFKPRLSELLGAYHEPYAAAASQALKRPGIQRQAVLKAPDLVVRSTSHLNVFSGRAYVPSLAPAGFDMALAR